MASPIIQTKIFVPTVRSSLVNRPHLLERLSAGRSGKLTLVVSPPGFGKTTLVTSWLTYLRSRLAFNPPGVAWVSLSTFDNDPIQFLRYLLGALQTIHPSAGAKLDQILKTPQPPALNDILINLINEFNSHIQPLVLVIDDYHLIREQSIHDAMSLWLEHQPAHMHLVIISRSEPPLPLGRLRVQGELTEINASDMRFNQAEAESFFRDVYDVDLPAKQVSLLRDRTEGWVAGLQLAALSVYERENIEDFIRSFGGSNRHVIEYLAEEVLAQQNEDVRQFLLQTSILERFNRQLCEAVVQFDDREVDHGHILSRIDAGNLFLIPLDDHQEWFRYHHLFADFLKNRLEQEGNDRPSLHRSAAAWFEEHDFVQEAIEHWLSAESYENALPLIHRACDDYWHQGRLATLVDWLKRIPRETLITDSYLTLFYAWLRIRYPDDEISIEDLPPLLDATQPYIPEQIKRRPILYGLKALVEAGIAEDQGQYDLVAMHAKESLQLLPPDSQAWREFSLVMLGCAYEACGNLYEARRIYHRAAVINRDSAPNIPSLLNINARLISLEYTQGHLQKVVEMSKENITLGKKYGFPELMGVKLSEISLAIMYYELNDLDEAEKIVKKIVSNSMANPFWVPLSHVLQAYIHLAREHYAEAQSSLDLAHELNQHTQSQNIGTSIATVQLRLWAAQNNLEAIHAWLEKAGSASTSKRPKHQHETVALENYAYALYKSGKNKDAVHMFQRLRNESLAKGQKSLTIQYLAMEAIASPPEAGLSLLDEALELAEPEGFVRIFLDLGGPILTLLRKISATGKMRRYARRLLNHVTDNLPLSDAAVLTPLSQRELSVLQLVASGSTNLEIAQRLYVSQNTVKTHLRRIYGKLGVSSREDAVSEARALNILAE